MQPGGPVRQPYPTRFLAPIDSYKIPSLCFLAKEYLLKGLGWSQNTVDLKSLDQRGEEDMERIDHRLLCNECCDCVKNMRKVTI